mgnify:CR=1 FL=1
MKIETQDISFIAEGKTILSKVSTLLEEGKFVGLIGPNGSGKSTLLKCIYRIFRPTTGAVYLDGRDMTGMPYKETAKRMAVVAQHNFYNFDFKVLDIVLMGRSPHKKLLERDTEADYKIARESLCIVGMAGFEQRQFSTLSGGEQQRVMLARALTQKTECIIMDEPTNHLDIKYQLQIMDIAKSLNIPIMAALHDLNIAVNYCDYLYALRSGEVIASGTPKSLITKEFLRNLFEVDTEILFGERGQMIIAYHSKRSGKSGRHI